MKNIQLTGLITILVATFMVSSCKSPETKKHEKGETIQDTSMPGQQNDGYPYNNPNSRRDNVVRDSTSERDSIIGK